MINRAKPFLAIALLVLASVIISACHVHGHLPPGHVKQALMDPPGHAKKR